MDSGLNDNVQNLGNVSKKGTENIIVWALFRKRQRNFKKRTKKRKRQHGTTWTELELKLRDLVSNPNKPGLVHDLTTLVFGVLQWKVGILTDLISKHPTYRATGT